MWAFTAIAELPRQADPVLSTLAQTILSSITLVMVAVAVLAVWKALGAGDKRAEDAQAHTEAMRKLEEKAQHRSEKFAMAFGEMKLAIDALVKSEEVSQRLQQEQIKELTKMTSVIDGTIRDAVRRRSYTPPPGTGYPEPSRG